MKFSPLKAFYPTPDELLAADRDHFDETLLRHLKTSRGRALSKERLTVRATHSRTGIVFGDCRTRKI